MQYVTLGKTGLKISRVGFGGIPIQRIDAEKAKPLIDALIECGINYIDTARGYTVSEEYIGGAIDGRRDKFVLATKSMARTREAMEADIETSLRNLRTDYIDLYQVHNPSMEQLDTVIGAGGALEALFAARDAGKIGHIGITAHSLTVFERALELDWVETIMFPYNIVESQCEPLLQKCRDRNIGFIAMKPMAGGAIEDGRIAMRYLAANELVTVAIPGMYCAEEVQTNSAAGAVFRFQKILNQQKCLSGVTLDNGICDKIAFDLCGIMTYRVHIGGFEPAVIGIKPDFFYFGAQGKH
mgnify:CR=1 FL=1